ncbi:MAG: dihydropteroate synthase [Actinomycetota bacterium]|nr:dihydropteroate synthase [Actinomycetota bacterium]
MRFDPRLLSVSGLDDALSHIDDLGSSDEGRKIMAPKMVHVAVHIDNLDVRAAQILKQNMLSIGGEVSLPREVFDYEPKKVSAVLSGTLKHYRALTGKLKMQPFGLKALAAELQEVIDTVKSGDGRVLSLGGRDYDLDERTLIMGIVNVTPDSFSDGGRFFDTGRAVEQALRMVEEGADILDVGGESTRPGSDFISQEEELERVMPVVEELAGKSRAPISIDTTKTEVARRALEAGCAMVNDVSAMRLEEEMLPLVVSRGVPFCLMHMQGMPKDMQEDPRYQDVIGEIASFLRRRTEAALEAGADPSNIIVDPGIGFGKTLAHNLEILRRLHEFKSLGYVVMLGSSRKSFIGAITGLPVDDRVEGTAASVALGIADGADIIRVHDVKEMARVAMVADAIVGKGQGRK